MATLTTVSTVFDREEALVARSFLDAHGITVSLPDWYTASTAWHWTVAIQGIRICVIDEELEATRSLLGSITPDDQKPEWPSAEMIVFALLVYGLTGIPHPIGRSDPAEYQDRTP